MTEKQYYCDDVTEYRGYGVFDLSKADKTINDFRDEDDLVEMWKFRLYLADETGAMMTGQEVVDSLNEQSDKLDDLTRINTELEIRLSRELARVDALKEENHEKNLKIKELTLELADLKNQYGIR